MDYEREPETELADSSTESELPTTVGGDAAMDDVSSMTSTDQAAPSDEVAAGAATGADDDASTARPESDLDSDADVLDDAFEAAPAPPEWPAADLVGGPLSADEAQREITAAYAAAGSDTDLGDDSDAPVLTDADADVNVSQGAGVQSINAKSVTFSQGGAAQVRAQEMNVSQSGVGIARVGNLTLTEGASAFAVVADQATVEEGSNTFLVVARTFSGETRPTIDWRTAMAFGAGVGVILSIFRRRR